jgi:glycosyltransferase involved in cell wall biosynthesis
MEEVSFYPAVPNYKAPEIYNKHALYVNLTPSGSLDKTILEACACGCIPIITNQSLDLPADLLVEDNAQDIAERLETWINASPEKIKETSEKLQSFVLENHSLSALVEKLEAEIKPNNKD